VARVGQGIKGLVNISSTETMKDLSNVPTADLVEDVEYAAQGSRKCYNCGAVTGNIELEQNNYQCGNCPEYLNEENSKEYDLPLSQEAKDKITELDRRCEGIRIVDDFPVFSNYRQIIYAKNDPAAREAVVNIALDELIERLKWLKLKPNV